MNNTLKFVIGAFVGGYAAYFIYSYHAKKKDPITVDELKNFNGEKAPLIMKPRNLIPSVYDRGIGTHVNF